MAVDINSKIWKKLLQTRKIDTLVKPMRKMSVSLSDKKSQKWAKEGGCCFCPQIYLIIDCYHAGQRIQLIVTKHLLYLSKKEEGRSEVICSKQIMKFILKNTSRLRFQILKGSTINSASVQDSPSVTRSSFQRDELGAKGRFGYARPCFIQWFVPNWYQNSKGIEMQ